MELRYSGKNRLSLQLETE